MRIKLFLTIISIFLAFGIYSQDHKKNWTDGKLTWDDFQEKSIALRNSELKYYIGYNTENFKSNDTAFLKVIAFCYVDKNSSYIKREFKNERYLRYNQVIFDLAELYRRKIQYDIDRVSTTYEIGIQFKQNVDQLDQTIDKFQTESGYGQNIHVITNWEKIVSNELNVLAKVSKPQFVKQNFGYALQAGLGSGMFTGSVGEHFGPTFNLMFGFDLAFRRSIFYINGTLAWGKVKEDYTYDQKVWIKDQNTNVAIIDISYGYAFIDNSKLKLSPFVGLGITEIAGKKTDDPKDQLRIVDYNLIFGINVDYKFKKRIKMMPNSLFGVKESVETSIRARFYITRANFYDDLNGYSINLTIGLCGFGNFLKLIE